MPMRKCLWYVNNVDRYQTDTKKNRSVNVQNALILSFYICREKRGEIPWFDRSENRHPRMRKNIKSTAGNWTGERFSARMLRIMGWKKKDGSCPKWKTVICQKWSSKHRSAFLHEKNAFWILRCRTADDRHTTQTRSIERKSDLWTAVWFWTKPTVKKRCEWIYAYIDMERMHRDEERFLPIGMS